MKLSIKWKKSALIMMSSLMLFGSSAAVPVMAHGHGGSHHSSHSSSHCASTATGSGSQCTGAAAGNCTTHCVNVTVGNSSHCANRSNCTTASVKSKSSTTKKGTYCVYHEKYHKKKSDCKKYCKKHKKTHSNGKRHHI